MAFAVRIAFSLLLLSALPALADDPPSQKPDPELEELVKLINSAGTLIQQGRIADAMTQAIDPAVARSDAKIASEPRRIYAVRTPQEGLLYMLQAANDKQSAVALSVAWSQSYFLKGYLLNGAGNRAEARPYLQHAIDMAPMNAQYLSEMGNLESQEKHWDEALKLYLKDEEAANAYSPANFKNAELGRALRGQGFVYVELNRLDDAEKAYRRCLAIDQNDQRAAKELIYVEQQKAKQGGAAQAAAATPAQAVAAVSPSPINAIFLFGRANYFRALARHRNCQSVNAAMLVSIDDRLEKARQRLAAEYGEASFPAPDKPVAGLSGEGCDPVTLNAYSTHVKEVEDQLPPG